MPTLIALRLPLPWDEFSLPNPLMTRSTVLMTGEIAWAWESEQHTPEFQIDVVEPEPGVTVDGWDLDHVVLLVPDLEAAVDTMAGAGAAPRLRMQVGGRPAAFFRVGPLLELIQSPVREPVIYGVALASEEALETVALRWRSLGRDVGSPRPAGQPGRRIMTVRATEIGFAVMSPDRAVSPT